MSARDELLERFLLVTSDVRTVSAAQDPETFRRIVTGLLELANDCQAAERTALMDHCLAWCGFYNTVLENLGGTGVEIRFEDPE